MERIDNEVGDNLNKIMDTAMFDNDYVDCTRLYVVDSTAQNYFILLSIAGKKNMHMIAMKPQPIMEEDKWVGRKIKEVDAWSDLGDLGVTIGDASEL
jgi:hypothetical protein